ncbi:Wzz/FepE/Etk N-terminal domain-containing protein [Pseudomonas sp. MWU12-2345]|uniref:Wzz/FepE/Etk N-terminal domain-containing protein n=1 Tax=Pseudomonas sp. MWU12-2345 TaxID=2928689 RepID=UPI00200EAFF6|nr:Wzz/FepE/Etk N-terminal domain-containing protein [Pseudomonas sp. MWU12-2345]
MVDVLGSNGVEAPRALGLIDFFRLFWRQRFLLFFIMLVSGGAGAGYAFWAVPVYEFNVVLGPPAASEVSALNYGRGKDFGLGYLTTREVYAVFARELKSLDVRHDFYTKIYLPSLPVEVRGSEEASYARFAKKLVIAEMPLKIYPDENFDKRFPLNSYLVVMRDSNAEQVKQWLQAFVKFASDAAVAEVVEQVNRDAMVLARSYDHQIEVERSAANDGASASRIRAWEVKRNYFRDLKVGAEGVGVYRSDGFLQVENIAPGKKIIVYFFLSALLGGAFAGLMIAGKFFFDVLRWRQGKF